jgi:hypothetical protein
VTETWVNQGKAGETSTHKDGTSLEWLNTLLLLMILVYPNMITG